MKKMLTLLALAMAIFSTQAQQTPTTYNQSEKLVLATAWFQRSAEMYTAYRQAYQYAQLKLDQNLAQRKHKKRPAAVVLDIDETILDNSPYEVNGIRQNFLYTPETWLQWTTQAKAKALPGALEFIRYAQKRKVAVFLISNRKTNELQATIANLQQLGFEGFSEKNILLKTTTSDKTERRQQVAAQYDMVLLIGDNLTDFDELFRNRDQNYGIGLVDQHWNELNQRFVMLPNPMYGDWYPALIGAPGLSPAQQDSTLKSKLIGY